MGRLRRFYYDLFSNFYDFIIHLHSKDEGEGLRDFLIEKTGVSPGERILDICTGTGAVVLAASSSVGDQGMAVGLDFSFGMLKKAQGKMGVMGLSNVNLVVADVGNMPFKDGVFDCVTCSHAMYELKAEIRQEALNGIKGVLKEGGSFYMMEHCRPKNPIVKFLYYIRLMSMGSSENRFFAQDEVPVLRKHFSDVKRELSPTGKSKLIYGTKLP